MKDIEKHLRDADEATPTNASEPVPDRLPEGQRNNGLTSIAGRMRRDGHSYEAILAKLRVKNAGQCEPPLDDDEVAGIARSVAGYTPKEDSDPVTPARDPPPTKLSPRALYGLAGEIVDCISPHTEADPAALLVDFLTSYGNAVGRGPYCKADGANHYTNLFIVLVGNTSKGRKGTARSQIRGLFEKADPDWSSKQVKSGLSSGEGLIWVVRDPITKWDRKKQEEVIEDPGVADKRALIVESEFAGTMKVAGREGNTLSPTLRNAWDHSGVLEALTKNSKAKATDAHISIIGHITRHELLKTMSDTEAANGFGNRFQFVWVKRSKFLPLPHEPKPSQITPLLERLKSAIDHGKGRKCKISLSEEAENLWCEIYPTLSQERTGMIGFMTARAEAQVLRLSLIYALLDKASQIDPVHLAAAVAVWHYCDESTRHLFGDSLGDPTADTIITHLKQAGSGGMTRTEIKDLFGGHRTSPVRRALTELLIRAWFELPRNRPRAAPRSDGSMFPKLHRLRQKRQKQQRGGLMSLMSLLSPSTRFL